MKSFLFRLSSMALGIAGGFYFLMKAGLLNGFTTFSWLSLGYLYVVTILGYALIKYSMRIQDNSRFMSAFAVAMLTKFMLAFIFLCYFIFIAPITNTNFIFPFFAIYFLFTGVLVWDALQKK